MMPTRPPIHRPHNHKRRSDRDRKAEHDATRGTSTERGYDAKWQRRRARHLQLHPLCAKCQDDRTITEATVVDHRTPLRHGGTDDDDNLMSLWSHHHNSWKQRQDARRYRAG